MGAVFLFSIAASLASHYPPGNIGWQMVVAYFCIFNRNLLVNGVIVMTYIKWSAHVFLYFV